MKTETIKAIFTNLLFVVGVGLLIFGFIRGALTASRLVVFDKYPLESYREERCAYEMMPYTPIPAKEGEESVAPAPEEDVLKRKQDCIDAMEHERNVRKIEDMVTAITTLAAGTVLVLSFRRFIFK